MHLECRRLLAIANEFVEANWEDVLTNPEEYAITEGQGAVPVDCLGPQSPLYREIKPENFN
jgi:hypothetical protein